MLAASRILHAFHTSVVNSTRLRGTMRTRTAGGSVVVRQQVEESFEDNLCDKVHNMLSKQLVRERTIADMETCKNKRKQVWDHYVRARQEVLEKHRGDGADGVFCPPVIRRLNTNHTSSFSTLPYLLFTSCRLCSVLALHWNHPVTSAAHRQVCEVCSVHAAAGRLPERVVEEGALWWTGMSCTCTTPSSEFWIFPAVFMKPSEQRFSSL